MRKQPLHFLQHLGLVVLASCASPVPSIVKRLVEQGYPDVTAKLDITPMNVQCLPVENTDYCWRGFTKIVGERCVIQITDEDVLAHEIAHCASYFDVGSLDGNHSRKDLWKLVSTMR